MGVQQKVSPLSERRVITASGYWLFYFITFEKQCNAQRWVVRRSGPASLIGVSQLQSWLLHRVDRGPKLNLGEVFVMWMANYTPRLNPPS